MCSFSKYDSNMSNYTWCQNQKSSKDQFLPRICFMMLSPETNAAVNMYYSRCWNRFGWLYCLTCKYSTYGLLCNCGRLWCGPLRCDGSPCCECVSWCLMSWLRLCVSNMFRSLKMFFARFASYLNIGNYYIFILV